MSDLRSASEIETAIAKVRVGRVVTGVVMSDAQLQDLIASGDVDWLQHGNDGYVATYRIAGIPITVDENDGRLRLSVCVRCHDFVLP